MPVPATSRYKTISAVLTAEQVERLEMLRRLRSDDLREASKSETLRVVVEAGLRALSLASDMIPATTTETVSANAAD